MAGKKGMKMKNLTPQDIERRQGNFAVTQEEVAKSAIPAPTPDKIRKFLKAGPGTFSAFESEEELQAKIEDYFNSCCAWDTDDDNNIIGAVWVKKPTLSGLAIHLGVARETIWSYGKSDRFSNTIKRAKDIITNFTEELLIEGKNIPGAINTLVNLRVGWVADEKTIKIEPTVPDAGAKPTDEIADFLEGRALPESDR